MSELVVVSAGLGRPSSTRLLADRLTGATVRALDSSGAEPAQVRAVELRDVAHELTDALLTGFAPPALRQVIDAVRGADGLIAVTPVFNASYSGLFKTFLDVLDEGSLTAMPVLLGATGGTARHSLALEFAVRPLFAYLRAEVVPTAVFAATADWGGFGTPDDMADDLARGVDDPSGTARLAGGGSHRASRDGDAIGRRIERAGRELAQAMLSSTRTAPDDEPEVISFERLLAGD